MAAGYGMRQPPSRHATPAPRPVLPTSWVLVAAVTTGLTCAVGSPWIGVAPALGAVVTRRPGVAAALVVLALIATVRTDRAWDSLAPDRLGPFDGWATVVGEPQRYPGAVRVIVEVDAERYELWVRGRARQLRAATWLGGDRRACRRRAAAARPRAGPPRRLAARRRRARRRLARRSAARRSAGRVVEPGAGGHRPRRRRPARRPGRADQGPRDRRRPRPAAGDGRAVPPERAVAPHCRLGPERGVRARRLRARCCAAPVRSTGG